MPQEIITLEDLQKFRLQLLEDIRTLIKQHPPDLQKDWLRSSEVRKMLGDKLNISDKTVAKHISNIFSKVEVGNKVELINKLDPQQFSNSNRLQLCSHPEPTLPTHPGRLLLAFLWDKCLREKTVFGCYTMQSAMRK
jgi:hypothetical protein